MTGDHACVTIDHMERDAVLNLRLPATVKTALGKAAADQMRTLSSMAAWALAEWAAEHGYLPKSAASNASRSKRGK